MQQYNSRKGEVITVLYIHVFKKVNTSYISYNYIHVYIYIIIYKSYISAACTL